MILLLSVAGYVSGAVKQIAHAARRRVGLLRWQQAGR